MLPKSIDRTVTEKVPFSVAMEIDERPFPGGPVTGLGVILGEGRVVGFGVGVGFEVCVTKSKPEAFGV